MRAPNRLALADPALLRADGYIGGRWIPPDSGGRFDVVDPATGEPIVAVADMGGAETGRAIAAAAAALPAWRALTAKQRSAVLRRWYELMVENASDLAAIITAEMGKPLAEGRGEILAGAAYVEWFAEEAKRAYGETIPTHDPAMRLVVIKQPVGVVAAITPWNFPFATIARKAAPALAAGCTVVAKPAEDTPLAALALAELAERAGVPAGVFNVVTTSDPAPVGAELTAHPAVKKISFTGSTEVGKLLMGQAAGTVKKVALELGGNAPLIVFDDADAEAAVAHAIVSKFRNGGQTCICANRILVQAGVYDEFVDRFCAAASALVVGRGADIGTDIGPLINGEALAKVQRLVDAAVTGGATARLGAAAHALGGTFYETTVLTGVTDDMDITAEEVFGPVASILRFDTDDEAVAAANDTPYGLAAYFFTRDLARAWQVGEALEYGMVAVNSGLLMTELAPFGGVKESGIGREGAREGLDEFLETKYLAMGGLDGAGS
ncbi:MAG: NAD-dependent succinate-semialdehyde dehydrogenase [Acidimicrobiaceae bacterium]|nr:NAD-dependent succinate-semialdehyde dehydrogenase [Acidimicrobiaceae bacterium]